MSNLPLKKSVTTVQDKLRSMSKIDPKNSPKTHMDLLIESN